MMEEVSKKPRGRPRRFSAEDMQRLARAQGLIEPVLSTYPELHWLLDPEALRRRKLHVYRRTIVEELGRIEDDNRLLFVARQLCELKPRTSAAVAIIRKFRGVQKGSLAPPVRNFTRRGNLGVYKAINGLFPSSHSPFAPEYATK